MELQSEPEISNLNNTIEVLRREKAENGEIIAALKEKIAAAEMREKTMFGINDSDWEITEGLKRLEFVQN